MIMDLSEGARSVQIIWEKSTASLLKYRTLFFLCAMASADDSPRYVGTIIEMRNIRRSALSLAPGRVKKYGLALYFNESCFLEDTSRYPTT